MTRIAILSDTHGNLTAFETALADIDARGIERIIHLGDHAGKGPRGAACCALARQRCEETLQGNWDVFLPDTDVDSDPVRWWKNELTPGDNQWLRQLRFSVDLTLGGQTIRCFHASSDDVFHRIWPTMPDEEWDAQFQNTPATGDGSQPDLVIYADIHHAYEQTRSNRTILNCGSVGNPLDEPTACYIVLSDDDGPLRWEFVRVAYDIEAELAVAVALRMPALEAWQVELRTAKYARG